MGNKNLSENDLRHAENTLLTFSGLALTEIDVRRVPIDDG
jgi:hypothetical protein